MRRRALLIGVAAYDHFADLNWCANDAIAVREALSVHADNEPNFDCHLLLGTYAEASDAADEQDAALAATIRATIPPHSVTYGVTFNGMRRALEELFAFEDMVLLFYSGHAYPSKNGACLVTQDGTASLPGVSMYEILAMANHSPAREIVIILDSCFAGAFGEPVSEDAGEQLTSADELPNVYLREGVTLLAAARPNELAKEVAGHGVFTALLLGALAGGAADVRGQVSAAAIYAYIEQALGPWDQRPIYKSNASRLTPIRRCTPDIQDADLRELPRLFPTPQHKYTMDPSYESTSSDATANNVRIFRLFKRLQVARLLRPSFAFDADLYFVALRSHAVELTPLGQFYRRLADDNRLNDAALQPDGSLRVTLASGLKGGAHSPLTLPDPEILAQLFHETYERLAPNYGYETRPATHVPWSETPEVNRRLMIAVATEVLATLLPLSAVPITAPGGPTARAES